MQFAYLGGQKRRAFLRSTDCHTYWFCWLKPTCGGAEHEVAGSGGLPEGEGLPAPEDISAVLASPSPHRLPAPPPTRDSSAASPGSARTRIQRPLLDNTIARDDMITLAGLRCVVRLP